MKIDTSIFTDAMRYNRIMITDSEVKIHNYDASTMGVMTVRKMDHAMDPAVFTLNEKDYRFISRLGNVDMDVTENEIRIKCKGSKYRFALLKEAPEFEPDLDNLKDVGVTFDVIQKASAFTGNVPGQPQYSGVNILNDVLMASNRAAVMRKKIANDLGYEINIPGSSIKHMQEHEKMFLKTNGKFLACLTPGRIFYTTLIENKISNVSLQLDDKFKVTLNRSELVNELKKISEYAETAKFTYRDDRFSIQASTNEQDFDIQLDAEFSGKAVIMQLNVKQLLLIVNAVEIDDVTLEFTDKAVRIFDEAKENEFLLPRYGQLEEVE